jgi:alpha-mannosidase
VRRTGKSTITQVLSVAPGSPRLDVATDVDWHESEAMLKAAWPLDLRAETSASETQFGAVQRATHTNTSWDAARFEICAHRYVHVAEPGWGAAVVNDSTYGHDVTRDVRTPGDGGDGGTTTTVRLSLLRAPHYPDPETDQGEHRLRYALVVGADLAAATREGSWINLPERRLRGARAVEPLVAASGDGVVLSAVKLADDGSGDVVVRLYESVGGRATARLSWGFEAGEPVVTDLLEVPLPAGDDRAVPLSTDGGDAVLPLRPFQVVTLRVPRAS